MLYKVKPKLNVVMEHLHLIFLFLFNLVYLPDLIEAFELELNWQKYDHCTILVVREAYPSKPQIII